jgi:hypothetical protein
MAESPRRVDLRLTISTGSPYRAVAAELAGKFAEYVGAGHAAATDLARAIGASIERMAAEHPAMSIDLELSALDRELVVTATSGATTNRATCPLPD